MIQDAIVEVRLVASKKEKQDARDFRQKHFFDARGFQDPYAATLEQPNHIHWLLYKSDRIVGYAQAELWPNHRAALRIIVIEPASQGHGLGKYLMGVCEQALKKRGVQHLHTEASPNAYVFYKKLGYAEMPFNPPDGEPTHPNDRAMRKTL